MDDPLAGHAKRPAIFLEEDGTLKTTVSFFPGIRYLKWHAINFFPRKEGQTLIPPSG